MSLPKGAINKPTSKEITNAPFLLFQCHKDDYHNLSRDNLRGVQQESLLSKVFFHPKNIKLLQRQIIKTVFTRTNGEFLIEEQDERDLQVVMRSIFLQKAKHYPTNIKEQVKELNDLVVDEVVPDIVSQLKMYIGYLDRAFNQPIPLERPKNVSKAGMKSLPSITKTFDSNQYV